MPKHTPEDREIFEPKVSLTIDEELEKVGRQIFMSTSGNDTSSVADIVSEISRSAYIKGADFLQTPIPFSSSKYDTESKIQGIGEALNLTKHELDSLDLLIDEVSRVAKRMDSESTITPDLVADEEYPDWKQIEIAVKTSKDIDFVYDHLKKRIREVIRQHAPEELAKKITLRFEMKE